MELIRDRNTGMLQKFGNLKYGSYLNDNDLSILRNLRTLRDDSIFIKKKLINIESNILNLNNSNKGNLVYRVS